MVKVLDYGLEEKGFDLRSYFYVHFWTNRFGKSVNQPIPQLSRLFFNKNGFGIK